MTALRIIFGIPVALLVLTSVLAGGIMLFSLPKVLHWEFTIAKVVSVRDACVVSYQSDEHLWPTNSKPVDCKRADAVELPDDAYNVKTKERQVGALTYVANGKQYRYEGILQDAGVYKAKLGEERRLRFDPKNPENIDTGEYKGANGVFWYIGISVVLTALYVWLLFLRGGARNGGSGQSSPVDFGRAPISPGSRLAGSKAASHTAFGSRLR